MNDDYPTIVNLAAIADSLPLKKMIPLQIGVTSSSDPKVAAQAAAWLKNLDGNTVADYLRVRGTEADLAYFARNRSDSSILVVILQHWRTPCEVLEELAPKLNPDLQELLVLRQDVTPKTKATLAALERNPNLSAYSRRRIWEYRQHLLPPEDKPVASEPLPKEPPPKEPPRKRPTEPRLGMLNWRELNIMACDPRYRPGVRRSAERVLLEQLPHLHAAERAVIARRTAGRVLSKLLYDANKAVVRVALGNPGLQEQSLLRLVASDRASPSILELVASHGRWRMRYSVRLALCHNPNTPFAAISGFVRTLQPRDLRALVARKATASEQVRMLAGKLYRGSIAED